MRLNLGSGNAYEPGFINIDANMGHRPDVVAMLPPIPVDSGSCQTVRCSHFLEHLTDEQASELIADVWRVLEPGGMLEVTVPFVFSTAAWQDPTHKSFWCSEKFHYYTSKYSYLKYGLETRYRIVYMHGEGYEITCKMQKVLS